MKSKTLKKIFKHKRSRKNKRSNKNIKRFGKKTRNFRKKYMGGVNDLVSMIQVSAPFATVALGNGLLAVGVGAASTIMAPLIVVGGGAAALYMVSLGSPGRAESLEVIAREFLSGASGQNVMSALPWGPVAQAVSLNPNFVAQKNLVPPTILQTIAAGVNAMQSQLGHMGALFKMYVVQHAQHIQEIISRNLVLPNSETTLVIVGVMLFALILGCFFKFWKNSSTKQTSKSKESTSNADGSGQNKSFINEDEIKRYGNLLSIDQKTSASEISNSKADVLQAERSQPHNEEEKREERVGLEHNGRSRKLDISQPGIKGVFNPYSKAISWTIPSSNSSTSDVEGTVSTGQSGESLLPLSELYKLVNEKREFTSDQRNFYPVLTDAFDDLRGQMIKIIHFNATAPELVTIFAHGDETGKILLSIIIKEYYDVDHVMKNPAMFDFYLIQANVPDGFEQNDRNLMDSSEITKHATVRSSETDMLNFDETTLNDAEWIKTVLKPISLDGTNQIFQLSCCENKPENEIKIDTFTFIRKFKIKGIADKSDYLVINGDTANETATINLSDSSRAEHYKELILKIKDSLILGLFDAQLD